MNRTTSTYDWQEASSPNDLKFFFISKGKQDIVKVVQYSFIQELNGRNIYNLGFGDYDLENDIIIDDINSNNRDAYQVFNTVLNTIPIFFQHHSQSILMIQGSDGNANFTDNCKLTCAKNCLSGCRNYNRRINIYRNYVNKNFDSLDIEYGFLGGNVIAQQEIALAPYAAEEKYDLVLLFQKKHKFVL